MAQTYTGLTTANAKASGNSLTASSVNAVEGTTIVVTIGYDNSQGQPTVVLRRAGATGGGKPFVLVPNSVQANAGTGMSIAQFKKRVHRTAVKDVFAEWGGNITARVMIVDQITEGSKKDVGNSAQQDASTGPATGSAVTSNEPNTISIAGFASQGPSSDTPGTAGAGHTLGQRAGTTGAPPVSNITVQTTWEVLTATGNIRATLSGATSRDWANTITAFAAAQTYTVTDVYENLRIASHTNNPGSNHVLVRLESETTADFIDVRIDVDEFDAMTDQEVTDRLVEAVSWHVDHVVEADLAFPEADSGRETRMATFVNDTVLI